MGAVKSLPILGEAVTTLDAGGKLIIAAAVAPFSSETAVRFVVAAKDSCVDYTERSMITATTISLAHLAVGNKEAADKAMSKVLTSWSELVDDLPLAGHAKGLVHYAIGDREMGYRSMQSANRGSMVLCAALLTLGAAPLVAAGTAIASGLAFDGYITAIDSAVHQE